MRVMIAGGGTDSFADQPVRHSGHGIGFKGQGGHTLDQGREHRRTGSVATDANHDLRFPVAQQTHAVEDAARQSDQRLKFCSQAYLVELANIDELESVAGLRHQAGFHASSSADETDLGLIRGLKGIGDCQRGNNVAARAAAGNHDPHIPQSISRVRLSSTPMLARVMNRDVPP